MKRVTAVLIPLRNVQTISHEVFAKTVQAELGKPDPHPYPDFKWSDKWVTNVMQRARWSMQRKVTSKIETCNAKSPVNIELEVTSFLIDIFAARDYNRLHLCQGK
jgi:hypothetical protein